MNYLLIILVSTYLLMERANCDTFLITALNTKVSEQSRYQFIISLDNDFTPVVGSTMSITFPSDYVGRLTAPCSIAIEYWPNSAVTLTPTCTFNNLVATISGLFTTGETYYANNPFMIWMDGPKNPYSIHPTGTFAIAMTLDTGSYSKVSDAGITCDIGSMSCTITTNPTKVNQKGKLIFTFTAPEFPIGATLDIQSSSMYWQQSQPQQQSGNEIIQSSNLNCQPELNANSGVSCTLPSVSGIYKITASNIVSSAFNNTSVSFSMATTLSPPTTQPQGSFDITSYINNIAMTKCSAVKVSSTTAGSITTGTYSTTNIIVNSAGVGTVSFGINSNIIPTDTFTVTFPSTMSLASLTSAYIVNGGVSFSPPAISNQTVSLSGARGYIGDTISVLFTNIINPPSQTTTSPFQITTYRNGYAIETSTGTITFSAYRSIITTATLSASSLQIGETCTYTVTFTLAQPLTSSSSIVVALPTALQGKVANCSSYSCTVTTTLITFTGVPTAVGSIIQLKLLSVTNPYNLGTTTSLTLYTLYDSTQVSSIVEYVNTGLTLNLIARASSSANAIITASSYVVSNYPTTYTVKITNLNPFFAYTYMSLYIPPEITMGGSVICQSGLSVQSCTYNSSSNFLVFSGFPSSLAAAQLSLSPFSILNLINPPSTMPTLSFQVLFYNSNNQLVQYITSGLSIQMTIPASFSALSLVPNNSINSALTSLSVTFNVPSSTYQNNTLLVLTFPSVIGLTNVACAMVSSNILAINQCSVYSNSVKIYFSYNSLSTFASTKLSIGPYNNYPSLQGYSIQVDLYGDTFQQAKMCSNINSPIILYNSQLGSIGISSFTFSNPILLSASNLLINFANASSTLIFSMTIQFPPDFELSSASCSAPPQISCSHSSSNVFNLTTSSTFSFPFTLTISNLITTAYSPSSYLYVQTFSSAGYQMDSNQVVYFATTCTLPCKGCQSAAQPSICTSCYSNSSLNQVAGAIYFNNSVCTSICGSGYYLDATLACLACSPTCLTCSSFSTCLTCNGSYLLNNTCLSPCPFTYYGSNFQCLPCSTAIFCKSCTDYFHCSSCINGYYYYNQQCLSSCPGLITFPNSVNNTCDNCPTNCTNCQGNSTLVTCTVCNNGYVLDGTGCYLACVTTGTFPVNGICQGCSSMCKTCSGTYTNCTSCLSNSTTPYLYNGNCISVCPNGYFADNSTFSCTKCISPCQYCTSSSVHSCLTCVTGYFLYISDCVLTCPANFYNSSGSCLACVSPCFTCTTELSCLSCANNTYLYQNQCLAQCPASMAVINGNTCLVCPSSCKTCSTLTTCTSCFTTSYLYNGTCYNICPATTYANTTTLSCDSCVSPCLTCSGLLTCITCADATKFLVNGNCVSCNSPCLTCSLSISNCTSCLTTTSTPYYLNFNCLNICPSNYYTDNVTFQCSLCASPCSTCYGPTNTSCSSCAMGYYLLLGTCFTTCPATYFNNITVCSPCLSPCLSCSMGKSVCISCVNSYYLSGSSCVTDCGAGMAVINNSICAFCSPNCQTCLSSNSSTCTSCYLTYYLQGSTCGSTCPNNYYADTNSSQCLACLSPCLTCQSVSVCYSCLDPSLFLVNGSCLSCSSPCATCSGLRTNCTSCNTTSLFPYLISGTCVASCGATYYASITYSCVKCNSPCNSCLNESTTYCLSCISNYYLLSNMCYVNCPTGSFPNITICSPCNSPCFTCSDANTCLTCISNYYLFGSTCVTNCSAGMAIINGNTCQYCSATCQTCSSSNSSACTSCYNNTYLFGVSCVTTCSSTYYSDNSVNKCIKCVGDCSTCQSATFCLSCLDTSRYLVNGSCVGCSSPCITCNGTTTTCTSCAVSTGYPYLLNNACLASCPSTYYNDANLNICSKCNSPCQTCTSAASSSCITCVTGYLLHSGYCITPCPAGFYSNGTNCLGCVSPCKNCYDISNCISCASGFYLMGSMCVTNCSSGMILINNTYCQYCTGSCITCLTSNSSFCTSCASTQFVQWGSCVNTCSSGYYGSLAAGMCLICQPPCGNCISDVLCLTCFDATLFLTNNSCVACLQPCLTCSITRNNCTSCNQSSSYPLLVNNLCLSSCPTGYYSSLSTCFRCNSPCDTCLSVSNSSCLTCITGYVKFNSSGACLLNCPTGYYSDTVYCIVCANNCSTCSSSSTCLTCPNGLYLLGSACTSSCPNGTISSALTGICSYCNSPCTSCQTLNTSYCTACPNNLFLSNGQCLSNCSSGYYANTALWTCSLCVNPCSTCANVGQCLSCLDPSSFLMNYTCVGCASQCLTCATTIFNCTACNTSGPYPYFYNNNCLAGCPSTYYNDSSFVCKLCASPCYTCTGSGNQSCITCLVGYYQLGSICYTVCPNGYYNIAYQCFACTNPCSMCTSSGNNSCTSCLGGLYLLGSSCVNNCSGLATSGFTCVYCSPNCNTCYTNNNSACTSCANGLYLFNSACVTSCSSGFYADSTAYLCMSCINNCSTCTSATSCLSCRDSTLFLINSQCVACSSICLTCSLIITNCTSCNSSSAFSILFGSTCLSSCPSTYYNNTPTSCALCSSPCSTCSAGGASACLTCLSGYYFLSNVCYSTCPPTFYQNVNLCSPCDATCYACQNSAFTCISCRSGFYLRGSTCVSSCPAGEVLINNTYCSVCTSNCLTCLSSNFSYCTSCSNGLYQLNGLCYSACPSQYYGNSSVSGCIPCKTPCATCNSDTVCLSCNPSTLFLINYSCQSCSSPCLTCQNLQTNCTSCNTTSAYPLLFNFNCLASCPQSYYNDGSFNCVKCNSPCDSCTSSSSASCITCLAGYSQLGTSCYLNCPSTYYSNGTYCLTCDLTVCKTCTITNTTCLSCATGLYLLGSLCNSTCPTGMIVLNGNICSSCLNGCLTCLTSNSSYCTSCLSGSYLYMGTCSSTCPTYFFADSTGGKCMLCQGLCLQCLSLTSCLSCRNPLEYLQNFTCVSSCTYPLIGINNVCYQCSSQCLTCVQNVSTCLLCANGFYYFSSSFSCSLYCSYYILRSNQSSSGNNECTQTCPSNTFTDSSSQYCQLCPTGCKTCTSLTYCSQCNSGYSEYLHLCYSPCPIAAPYSVNSICIMCNISNCQTCLNTTSCSSCSSTYLLISSGGSSSCITACPTGFIYDLNTTSCLNNTANQTSTSSSRTVVSSAIPPFTFLITTAALVFACFIIKFKYSETYLSLIVFVSVIVTSSCCLINVLYIQLGNSGILQGNLNQVTISTYLILSSGAVQVLTSLASFIAILKIRDPAMVRTFKSYPVVLASIMVLSIVDSNLLFLTVTNFMNFDCFKIKYTSQTMEKVFQMSLGISIGTKLLNMVYSGMQLNYFSSSAVRLLVQTANFPVNSGYTVEFIIICCLAILMIIYLLYTRNLSDKVDNSKNESNQSLIDDSHAFDKRNSSNSQLIFQVESSDMIVDINSLKDQHDITLGSETKRYKKTAKVTPDEMLEKMNNGIEEEPEKEETQEDNVNKNTRQEFNQLNKQKEKQNQLEFQDINNVFYFEEEDTKQKHPDEEHHQQPSEEQHQQHPSEQHQQQHDQAQRQKEEKDKEEDNNANNPLPVNNDELNQTPEISEIIYNDHEQPANEPSKLLENQIFAIQEAINEKTKTEIINVFHADNNELKQNDQQKYSPSQLSKYQPNKKIEQEFANSYLDDANRFNEHNEVMKKSGQFINFEVDNKDFNQFEEISFQNRQNFATISHPSREKTHEIQVEPKPIYRRTEWDDLVIDAPAEPSTPIQQQPMPIEHIIPITQPIMKIEEDQQFNEYSIPQKVTPMKNSFFEPEENNDDMKPSEGFNRKGKKHKKPDIPLPKNQIEKEIMNIYQKKEKKQLPPRKKRYPDQPSHTKMSNQVQYSMDEKEFMEEKGPFKPIFSGEIKKQQVNRYNQSRASNQHLHDDEEPPEKPSIRLRKSSFKKIGEMVLEPPQSSSRK